MTRKLGADRSVLSVEGSERGSLRQLFLRTREFFFFCMFSGSSKVRELKEFVDKDFKTVG